MEHDEKHPQPKLGGNLFMGAYEPDQFTRISMGLITYSCGHISGHYEQIWCVGVFHHVLLKYGHESAVMQK